LLTLLKALWVSEQTAVAYDGDKGYMVPRDQLATLPGLCRDRLWLFDIGRADRLVCDSCDHCNDSWDRRWSYIPSNQDYLSQLNQPILDDDRPLIHEPISALSKE
jgi:hypothetical protein